MKRSEQCDQLYAALALARANFGTAERTKEAKIKGKSKMSGESFEYKYKYAPLEECFKAIDQALSDQGLALIGGVEYGADGQMWVITHLGHTSGQWIENALSCGIPEDSKDMGGKITYARRYGVTLTVQMQAEDDDDGPRGEESQADRRQAKKPTPKPMVVAETPANGAGVPESNAPSAEIKLLPADIAKLLDLLKECYQDSARVDKAVRQVMQIPAEQSWNAVRLRHTMTMAQYTQLQHDAHEYAKLNIEQEEIDVDLTTGPNASESTESHESLTGEYIGSTEESTSTTEEPDAHDEVITSDVVSQSPSEEHQDYATPAQLDALEADAAKIDDDSLQEVKTLRTRHRNISLRVYREVRDRLLMRLAQQAKAAKV